MPSSCRAAPIQARRRRSQPPVPDARLGRDRDGQPAWFVPDPAAQGKYLRSRHDDRSHGMTLEDDSRRVRSLRGRRARARRADHRGRSARSGSATGWARRPRWPTTSPIALRLRGALDVGPLASALDRLVERHDALRATISPDGTQLLVGGAAPLEAGRCTTSARSTSRRAPGHRRAGAAAVREPFDPRARPAVPRRPLRALRRRALLLLIGAPHRVRRLVVRRDRARTWAALYAEQLGAGPTPDAPARYRRLRRVGDRPTPRARRCRATCDYWLARFSGRTLPVLELPLDRPAPRGAHASARGASTTCSSADSSTRCEAAARRRGTSLFATLLGGLRRAAAPPDRAGRPGHRHPRRRPDRPSDMPDAGRPLRQLAAACALAVDAPAAVPALVRQIRHACCSTPSSTRRCTYRRAAASKLPVPRDPSRLPLVSVMFNVDHDAVAGQWHFPGLDVALGSIPRTLRELRAVHQRRRRPMAGGMRRVPVQRRPVRRRRRCAAGWRCSRCLLRSAIARRGPGGSRALDLLPDAERSSRARAAAGARRRSAGTAADARGLRGARRRAHPSARRCVDGAARCTYARARPAQSNRAGARAARARRAARRSASASASTRRRHGRRAARRAEVRRRLRAARPGLSARAPGLHGRRRAACRRCSRTRARSRARLDGRWHAAAAAIDADAAWRGSPARRADRGRRSTPDDVGLRDLHLGLDRQAQGRRASRTARVVNFLAACARAPGLGADDVLLAVTTLSLRHRGARAAAAADASGAEVVLAAARRAPSTATRCARCSSDTAPPSCRPRPATWRLLIEAGWRGRARLQARWSAARRCRRIWPTRCSSACGELWNMYGPTETTVWSTVWRVAARRAAGIAHRQARSPTPQVYVLDAQRQPVPDRRAGRALHRRRRRRARLPRPARADRRALRPRSVRGAPSAAVPHRRPRPLAPRRPARVPRPHRLPGQGARLPHRARRDRGRAATSAARRRAQRGASRARTSPATCAWWPTSRCARRGARRRSRCASTCASRCPST